MSSWKVYPPMTGTPWVDILPDDDLIKHEWGEECVCGPSTEYVNPTTGGTYGAPLVTHHSLDGRELYE